MVLEVPFAAMAKAVQTNVIQEEEQCPGLPVTKERALSRYRKLIGHVSDPGGHYWDYFPGVSNQVTAN